MIELLKIALETTLKATKEVLFQYENGFEVFIKKDNSPVTSADLKAHEIFIEELKNTSFPILSEEGDSYTHEIRSSWDKFWCIDPIDGTREFVDKTDEYCLSIGLIDKNTSYLGILCAPSLNLLYFACEGLGSYKYNLEVKKLIQEDFNFDTLLKNSLKLPIACKQKNYTFLTSRTHRNQDDENYLAELQTQHQHLQVRKMGSAIKLGLVCEGYANEYARLSYVNFWDLAGGHAIAKYANLPFISLLTKEEPTYNDENMKNKTYQLINTL